MVRSLLLLNLHPPLCLVLQTSIPVALAVKVLILFDLF